MYLYQYHIFFCGLILCTLCYYLYNEIRRVLNRRLTLKKKKKKPIIAVHIAIANEIGGWVCKPY